MAKRNYSQHPKSSIVVALLFVFSIIVMVVIISSASRSSFTMNSHAATSPTSITAYRVCDINRDGVVNVTDKQVFDEKYQVQRGTSQTNSVIDLNRDGLVNSIDYQLFYNCYNGPTPTPTFQMSSTRANTPTRYNTRSPLTPTRAGTSGTPTPQLRAIVLNPIEDSYVASKYPSSTNGTKTVLVTSNYDSTNTRYSYLKFDLSSIPVGKQITKVLLRVNPSLTRSVAKDAKIVSNSWSQATLNWNNKPALGQTVGTYSGTATTGYYIDFPLTISSITPSIQGSGSKISFAIINKSSTSSLEFYSRESSTNKPMLVFYVVY